MRIPSQRTARDFAVCMRDLTDTHYPEAELIRVVLDNLSTHTAGALYETFPPPEAHRILQRVEFHRAPKHASWLNMAEIEIGVLRGRCLDRRIGERALLVSEIAAWQQQRNASGAPTTAWHVVADNLATHVSESVVRLVADLCGIEDERGEKGKSAVPAAMVTREAFLRDAALRTRSPFTPRHASWLNQIEIWFSIRARKLLRRAGFTS